MTALQRERTKIPFCKSNSTPTPRATTSFNSAALARASTYHDTHAQLHIHCDATHPPRQPSTMVTTMTPVVTNPVVIYSDDAHLLPLRHTCMRLHCPIASRRPLSNVSMSEPPDNVTIAPVTPDASFAKLAWTPSTPILAAITPQPPSNVVYAVAAAPEPIDLLQTLEPSSDDSDCCSRRSVSPVNLIQMYSSASSQTSESSQTSDDDVATVAATTPPENADLLPPPFFIGIITPPSIDRLDYLPPQEWALECALDSMCLGKSVIRKSVTDALKLPRVPHTHSSKTTEGNRVVCTELAFFCIHVFINSQWMHIQHEAMVWEKTAEPLLLSNSFCLDTSLYTSAKLNMTASRITGKFVSAVTGTRCCVQLSQHDSVV